MINNLQITKALFQDQIHERFSFSVNYQGNDYQGIYHAGDISWFNPHPLNKLQKNRLEKVESEVDDKMQKLLS